MGEAILEETVRALTCRGPWPLKNCGTGAPAGGGGEGSVWMRVWRRVQSVAFEDTDDGSRASFISKRSNGLGTLKPVNEIGWRRRLAAGSSFIALHGPFYKPKKFLLQSSSWALGWTR